MFRIGQCPCVQHPSEGSGQYAGNAPNTCGRKTVTFGDIQEILIPRWQDEEPYEPPSCDPDVSDTVADECPGDVDWWESPLFAAADKRRARKCVTAMATPREAPTPIPRPVTSRLWQRRALDATKVTKVVSCLDNKELPALERPSTSHQLLVQHEVRFKVFATMKMEHDACLGFTPDIALCRTFTNINTQDSPWLCESSPPRAITAGPSKWALVDLDSQRHCGSSPSRAITAGQSKCAHVDFAAAKPVESETFSCLHNECANEALSEVCVDWSLCGVPAHL